MGKVNRPPPKYRATRRPIPDVRAELELIQERMRGRIQVCDDGCHVWTGWLNKLGYPELFWRNRQWMGTRLMYAAHHGPFDPWLDVRHSCDNPACVNIDHLSLGTRADNMRDSVDRRRSKNAKKTHCPQGHSYAEHGELFVPNTRHYKPWRRCKICDRERHQQKAAIV